MFFDFDVVEITLQIFIFSVYKKEKTMKIDRRDFLKLLGMGSAVLVLGPRSLAGAAMPFSA